MTDMRFIVSYGPGTEFNTAWMSNTLYFTSPNITGIDYQSLADDLRDIYETLLWTIGCKIEVRAYQMSDDKPRPERAYSTLTRTGTQPQGPHQIALCLSYYSERNLPRQRGRIYCGPFANVPRQPAPEVITSLLDFGEALGDLGGVDIDWSVFSPTKAQAGQDPTMSISNIWVDNSWDVIRSRKEPATSRTMREINE